jgi:Fur family transcriptional regulator, ferric uptake regulator
MMKLFLDLSQSGGYNRENDNHYQQGWKTMTASNAKRTFETFLKVKRLRHSRPRLDVMDAFIKADRHLTADELFRRVREEKSGIGFATVYRTLKLMCESGLCRELQFKDGVARYEPVYNHQHHDHLICTQCGRLVEVVDPEIERLQDRLFVRHKFVPRWHRLELYGVCPDCGQAPIKAGRKDKA